MQGGVEAGGDWPQLGSGSGRTAIPQIAGSVPKCAAPPLQCHLHMLSRCCAWLCMPECAALLCNHAASVGAQCKNWLDAGLKCWAYSPPGGLVSPNLSPILAGFCCGVAVAKDSVPRLTLKNLDRLLDEMIVALARSNMHTLRREFILSFNAHPSVA